MRRAAKIDANHHEIVAALQQYGCQVQSLAGVGGGVPDLLILSPPDANGVRRLGLVEIKDGSKPPSHRRRTADQIAWWDRWSGAPVGLVTDIQGALRFARLLTFSGAVT